MDNKSQARTAHRLHNASQAVMTMLQPGYSVRGIAVRRRNPWFKRGILIQERRGYSQVGGHPNDGSRDYGRHDRRQGRGGAGAASPQQVRDLQGGVTARPAISQAGHDRGRRGAGRKLAEEWLTLAQSAEQRSKTH
jgi:hypothetical protein